MFLHNIIESGTLNSGYPKLAGWKVRAKPGPEPGTLMVSLVLPGEVEPPKEPS